MSRTGSPLDPSVARLDFARTLRRAGLARPGLTPHSTPHSFASWHIAAGRNPKWVQQQLGHASIEITLDVYADHFKLVDADAATPSARAWLATGLATAGSSGIDVPFLQQLRASTPPHG